jgi:hypothetical protein
MSKIYLHFSLDFLPLLSLLSKALKMDGTALVSSLLLAVFLEIKRKAYSRKTCKPLS